MNIIPFNKIFFFGIKELKFWQDLNKNCIFNLNNEILLVLATILSELYFYMEGIEFMFSLFLWNTGSSISPIGKLFFLGILLLLWDIKY